MNKSNHHNKRESDSGIDHIFHHEKCSEFDDETKEKVITAYRLAVTLHRTQRRHNNKPYIDHINRSIDLYLDNTLSSSERCNPEYIIALILHDCIEDNENGLREIIKKGFDIKIILDILWMSESKPSVIVQVDTMKKENPFVYSEIWRTGFLDIYSTVNKNDPVEFVELLETDERLSENMCRELRSLWARFFSDKYHAQSDKIQKQDIYAEYMLLCMIAGMPRELFRIKATERRDNMRDIEGLLNVDKAPSAIKTMETTFAVYVPRARELGLEALIYDLIEDRNSEFARFVLANLIAGDHHDEPPHQVTISR